jgi:hypothetical protein
MRYKYKGSTARRSVLIWSQRSLLCSGDKSGVIRRIWLEKVVGKSKQIKEGLDRSSLGFQRIEGCQSTPHSHPQCLHHRKDTEAKVT